MKRILILFLGAALLFLSACRSKEDVQKSSGKLTSMSFSDKKDRISDSGLYWSR